MIFRCVDPQTRKIVGAIDLEGKDQQGVPYEPGKLQMCNAWHCRIGDGADSLHLLFQIMPWWIDTEGNVISESQGHCTSRYFESTRLEFMLNVKEEYVQALRSLPNWKRVPPERIIDLGHTYPF